VIIPGVYGMSKVVSFLQKRQAILHRQATGRASLDLIEEDPEEELE
jgi:hypothetical protein